MLIGYIRVSKSDGSQVLDLQRDAAGHESRADHSDSNRPILCFPSMQLGIEYTATLDPEEVDSAERNLARLEVDATECSAREPVHVPLVHDRVVEVRLQGSGLPDGVNAPGFALAITSSLVSLMTSIRPSVHIESDPLPMPFSLHRSSLSSKSMHLSQRSSKP